MWQNSRDFDDTYSVKSGRRSDISRHREAKGNSSSGHESRSERITEFKDAYDNSSDRFKIGAKSSASRPGYTSAESRQSRDGRYNSTNSGFASFGGSRHSQEQIHVRHPSPVGYESPHPASRRGHESRSRSQSPSLAQILGLSKSQKRTSATVSRSSSPQQGGMFTGFFSTQPSRSRSKQSNKKKGFFNFANSSSSSANSDLAFGIRPNKNVKPSRRATKKSSDEHLKATLLGIGATAAALSAVQRGKSGSKKSETMRLRNQDILHTTQRTKRDTSEEEGWESASDDESISSGLAFGDLDGKVPRRQRSSESITSQSSGTDKWSWRWRRKPNKKVTTDDISQTYRGHAPDGKTSDAVMSQPLQYVHPMPISSPMHSEARGHPSMPGAFPEQQYASEYISIQQPQPVMPLQSRIFGDQTPPHVSDHVEQPSPRVSTRPTIPTELRRTQSSPVSGHTMRNAAIVGLAGAAAAGILSNGKSRFRDDSPSNVRFELTEKQAKKEELQQRKDDAKESRERAKVEARENKERARLDRERALKEESDRVDAENARRHAQEAEHQKLLAEQADRYQAHLRDVAAAEAREREEDRQREEEIKEFMKNALAEQAREAEAKKQREAWEAQQIASSRQDLPPDSRDGPSTTSQSAVDQSQDYYADQSRRLGDAATSMPYATRSYEPSNEHSGQPLMDDDLIDPDFFIRRRSHSELARHEELARKAAAKIVADLENRYKDPAPSQAEFFAPKELFEPSKGKTKVHGPIDDTDYHVYHMTEDQVASMPNEPPPPYQPSYQFASLRDLKRAVPWDIPKLNVIAPTPPASYAGSAKGDRSPVGATKKVVRPNDQKSDDDTDPPKSNKVSWGEDQTRFYEITTPQSSQEQIVSELPRGPPESRTSHGNPQSAQEEFYHRENVTSATSFSNDQKDEPVEEIVREPLFASSESFYRQPFVESVDDIAFTIDSPGTEGAPPVQGFIEGEVDDVDEIDDQMPHIPDGFEDTSPDPRPEDTFKTDIQNLSREVMQEQQAPRAEPSQISEQGQDDYFMTKKQRRKRDMDTEKASLDQERQSLVEDHQDSWHIHQSHSDRTEDDSAPKQNDTTSKSGQPHDSSDAGQSSGYATAGAIAGAAAAIGTLVNSDSSHSLDKRMSEPDTDRQREPRSQSQPRDTVSQSTPTSPVYERRQSLPSHAFDDLDMLSGSKRPKKSKRNSLLNYPTIGSPLRSAMTWDEYIEPLDATQHNSPARSRSDETHDNFENPVEDAKPEAGQDLPSPDSECGAASVVSAPAGAEDSGRRRKSRKSHREHEKSSSPRRSSSVAMSEPYESSRKHKRRSHRDDDDIDDASSARSRSSHSSRRDDDESRSKKKGGILSLFRRKTSDDISNNEQRRTHGDDESSKHHRRRHSSEHTIDEFDERRSSISRSRSHAEKEEASSRHSSSSRHRRRHHRDGSVDEDDAISQASESRRRHKHRSRDHSRSPEKEFDDTQSQSSESRRKHRHRDREHDLSSRRSFSRDSKTISDEDKSFLVERVEDEEPLPLPEDDISSSSQAPEPVEQPQEPILLSEPGKIETLEQPEDSTISPTVPDELKDLLDIAEEARTDDLIGDAVQARSSPPLSESLSPPLEHMTPTRPIVPLRISSSTAVPLRFRRPPTSPSLPRERSASFSSPVAPSPSSPITPKAKRPLSTEFMHSTEFRPLYLLERTRKPQDQEAEQNLPSLPPSRSASSSSLQSSEDWQSAAEDFEPSEQENSSPPTFDQSRTDELEDILGSAQTTPKATEFPQHVLESRPHPEPEYYSWADMEREEHLRQEAESKHRDEPKEEPVLADDAQVESISAVTSILANVDTEIAVNQDPTATDVWGEVSDEELPTAEAPTQEESAEPILQPQETEASSSFAVSTKKRKNKKAAKLGTSLASEITSPGRETPAEFARRREKDAQDAVDTWSKPDSKLTNEALLDASHVSLPESTTSTEAETHTPMQENETMTQEIEPGSPLLSRKKSKKSKKKQKSVILDEPDVKTVSIGEPSEPQSVAETEPQQKPADDQANNEFEDGKTRTAPEEIVQGQESGIEIDTVSTVKTIMDSATPDDREQPDNDVQMEEPAYTMSKAERKKNKKKAKKAALSIAVPAVAAAALATSDRKGLEHNTVDSAAQSEPVLVEDREDETPAGIEDIVFSAKVEPLPKVDTIEHQTAATEPTSSAPLHTELLPEQVALPQESQDEVKELGASNHDPEIATGLAPVPEAPLEDQAQPAAEESPEERLKSSPSTIPEATSKRSSWISWLPGSKTQVPDMTRAGSEPPQDKPGESNALTQEPFERLLEQPMHQPDFVEESNIILDTSKDMSGSNQRKADINETDAVIEELKPDERPVEDTELHLAQPQLEESLPMTTKASADNVDDAEIAESASPITQNDLPPAEETSSRFEHAPAEEEASTHLPDSGAAGPSGNVQDSLDTAVEEDSAPAPARESVSAEDPWVVPSKKSKKGKKAKKAAKEKALSETVSPFSLIGENRSLNASHLQTDNPDPIESDKTFEAVESEPPSNVDIQGSDVDAVAYAPAPATSVVEDTGLSSTFNAKASRQDDSSEAVSQLLEPAAEFPKATVIPIQSNAQNTTPGEGEQAMIGEPVSNAEPSAATAEDEWAMPSSKKKKKKGKKGKQPLKEVDEIVEDVPATTPPELQTTEVSTAIEQTPVTPDVFETPAEDPAAQYFATPADELADQYFVTPSEESPEQHLAVPADEDEPKTSVQEFEADSMSQEQLRHLSVTPTQASHQSGSAVLVEEPRSLEPGDHTDSSADDPIREAVSTQDSSTPILDDAKDTETSSQDEIRPSGGEQVIELTSQPASELSAAIPTRPVKKLDSIFERGQPNDLEAHLDLGQEEDIVSKPEASQQITSASSEPDLLDRVSDQLEPQDDAETSAFVTTSPKTSKKDKKKAKKTKQQDIESESFQSEAAKPDFPQTLGEAPEVADELKPEISVTTDVDVPLTSEQLPELKTLIEEQPVARKLSKKEKRKAKKAVASEQASTFDDTPERSSVAQDATSYSPDSAEYDIIGQSRAVEVPEEPQVGLLSTPLNNIEDARHDVKDLSVDQIETEKSSVNPATHSKVQHEGLDTMERDAADRDATSDAKFDAYESNSTEAPLHEIEPASTDLNGPDVPPAEEDPVKPADLSYNAQNDDQEISPQTIKSEPADVKDQAPSILDQLILAEGPATVSVSEPVKNDDLRADIPSAEAEDHNAPADVDIPPIRPIAGSLDTEEPTSSSETLAEGVEGSTARDEPESEQPVREPASEEQSQVVTDLAPPKMSKKDKRKAKRSKQTVEPTLESSDTIETQIPGTESPVPVVEEGLPALMTANRETAEITDDIIPRQPIDRPEPFAAKLSKKAKKKAKTAKAKNTGIDDEDDELSSMPGEAELNLTTPSNEDRTGEAFIESSQTSSAELVAHVGPETEQGHIREPTTSMSQDVTQDVTQNPELVTDSGHANTLDSGEPAKITPESVEHYEHTPSLQPADMVPAEQANENVGNLSTDPIAETVLDDILTREILLNSEDNDKSGIVKIPEAPQAVDNEVTSATVPDLDGLKSPEDNEQSTAQTIETPMAEEEDEFFTMTPTSKKKKKKGKKAKLQQETTFSEMHDGKSLPSLSNDAEESVTYSVEISQDTPDKPMSTVDDETLQPTAEGEPSTVLADEWKLPTKQSKKENRKAKKLKNLEDDLLSETIEQKPIIEPPMPEEAVESPAPPISQSVESELPKVEPESVVDPDTNDDWSFSRKLSKKEKRNNKKASTVNEQKVGPEPLPIAEDTSGIQHSHIVDQAAASPNVEPEPKPSDLAENSSAEGSVAVEGTLSERFVQEHEATTEEDKEPASTVVDTSQDIDFAATLAAGLQDSGFDPNLVIDDPVFHRRASPTSVGEADSGEVTTPTTRRPQKSSGQSGSASPVQDIIRELPVAENPQPAERSMNDDFSDTLTAGLIASGFAADTFTNLSADATNAQVEPEDFSFAIPKRKKKGKKSTRDETMVSEAPVPTDGPESHHMSDGDIRNPMPGVMDDLPTHESKEDPRRSETAERGIGPIDTSPTRSAKPTFFHTSEVSQFLPVSIDHPVQSDPEFVQQDPQESADLSMIETLAKDIPHPTLEDAPTASTTDSVRPPVLAGIHNEPATWSFDNLDTPTVKETLQSGQSVHGSYPFVTSDPITEKDEQITETDPVSPVESTTKDRTSYLFQSPVDATGFDKVRGLSQGTTSKQTRFYEPEESLGSNLGARPQTPPAPLPPSPPQESHIPLPPTPSRVTIPPAPLPPSPSHKQAISPTPLPPDPQPDQSPPLIRKKSLYDIGSPGAGHSSKAARRSATPQQTFRAQINPSQLDESPAFGPSSLDDQLPILRPVDSNRSIRGNREQLRATSSASNHSAGPSLRRINRSLSGDLRAASRRRGDASMHGPPTTIPIEPPPTPPLQDEEFNGHGASRPSDMANIYVSTAMFCTIAIADSGFRRAGAMSAARRPCLRRDRRACANAKVCTFLT